MIDTIDIRGYELGDTLYESDTSLVFRARQRHDDTPVVLKILKGRHPDAHELARYEHEYAVLSSLDIEGVIRPIRLLDYGNTRILVLEDFGADSLRVLSGRQAFPLADVLRICIAVARALGELHARYVVHKDVNPSNIVYDPTTGLTKIIDFGIAAVVSPSNPQLEAMNRLEGTLAYLAPEQTGRMNRVVDFRSDLYALGITMYELLTGRLPFTARHALEWVHAQIARVAQPVHSVDRRIPETLSEIVARLMAKTAEARYQSAAGLEHDLRECLQRFDASGGVAPFSLGQQDRAGVFYLPRRLYGRQAEVRRVLDAFEQCRADAGSFECLLVSGYSGTGKTSLVKEVYKTIAGTYGYFTEGKFDQYQRAEPYSAIRHAIERLVAAWLSEPDDALAVRRGGILAAIGDLGQVLVELVPTLAVIIGPQPALPELTGIEAQNRLNLACRRFFKAAATREQPLVVFIDDLHWADLASLNLLGALLTDRDIRDLLLIAAYRDNEVDQCHPLSDLLRQLRDDGVTPGRIQVGNLGCEDVAALLADALLAEASQIERLAVLIHRKTLGNAFFVHQLLKMLHQEGLIRFDPAAGRWNCDTPAIERHGIADDVVALMAAKIRALAPDVRRSLELAACVGNRFGAGILALIGAGDGDEPRLARALEAAVSEGLLLPDSDSGFRFAHDRIQQAAYSLISEEARVRTHLQIGRTLLRERDRLPAERRVFDIVTQLDAGLVLIVDADERLALARLNLEAARTAQSAAAYAAAVGYLRIARELLPPDGWTDHYDLTFAILCELARCCCLAGEIDDLGDLFDLLLKYAADVADRVAVYRILMEHSHLRGDYAGAIRLQLEALDQLGVAVPEDPEALRQLLHRELADVESNAGERSIESLIDAPTMRSRQQQMVMDVLMSLWTSAYLDARKELVAWASCRMTNISLRHGNNHLTAYAYMNYGFVCVALLDQYERGHRFGRVALRLSERYDDLLLRGKVHLLFAVFINHWRAPLISSLEHSRKAFPLLAENGDWTYAGYCAEFMISDPMIAGRDCRTLLEEARRYIPFLEANAPVVLEAFYRPVCLGPLLCLMGMTEADTRFDDADFSEAAFLDAHRDDALALSYFYVVKLRALYWMGAFDEAMALVDKVEFVATVALAQAKVPEMYLFASLTVLAGLSRFAADERPALLVRVRVWREQLRRWADASPQNFLHKRLLVEAELARVDGNLWHALELFERAIEAAHTAGYLNNEALAYELSAVLRAEHGLERPAAFYMNEARYLWRKSGAAAKVRQLERRWPRLLSTLYDFETRGGHDGTATLASIAPPDCEVSASSDALDMISILHASQSLAEELRLEGLLNRMMAILMENAGADRCVLMLAEPQRWVAKAESRTSWPGPSRLPDPDIESLGDALPLTLVHYCIRTRQQVVLTDASADRTYRKDPYFSASAMKSVLCLPLALRGELLGLVYLENNLMTGAFTQSRRRVLDLLSGQMAISIQNAEFYTHLEDMVDQRTGELTQVNERLQQANAELQQLSTTDGLTGAANRRCFDDFLEREWIRHARRQWPLAILLCDIDHFKLYNDTHGHLAGDDCLIRIVGALGTAAGRAGDLVARYGGDELVVVLTETGEIGLSAVIDRIQERVASLEIPHAASPVDRFVTLSIGACWGIPAGVGWSEAVAIADRALYVAKARGRNRSVISALVPA